MKNDGKCWQPLETQPVRDDVVLNKVAVIERCLRRVAEDYQNQPKRLENFTIQDAIILNIQRACEAAIDLAMHVVAQRRLGVPQDARSAFDLLHRENLITANLAQRLKAMVGFRNIAVHDYQQIQVVILERILAERLGDLTEFGHRVLAL
jgi:uncharacterized protein YutE (UPF0331/DUF86 family)